MWDLSCPDWRSRLAAGRSLIPDLPLIQSEADIGLRIFDQIRLPDVPGKPMLGDAAGQWFRDIVRVSFGSWDPETQQRFIRDIFAMAPKGSSKTSYSAALMLTAMLMSRRPRGEALFVGPTQAVSDRAYEQAVGMIDESADLKRRFRPRDHLKTIEDKITHSEMKVRTFDLNILTGSILIFVLLDELHLLGRSQHTTKVLRQIRGGLDKTPEGLLLITTTQSDDIPAGAFADELGMARKIRDGEFRGKTVRSMLPVIYEFPEDISRDRDRWSDPANWPMVMPNLGKSVHLSTLVPDWETERSKGEHAIRIWASQHLNLEIGMGLSAGRWRGADYWEARADKSLTLAKLLDRCEVIVAAVDGGGLDDMLALALVGRERDTRRWLSWNRTWLHRSVLDLRKSEASRFLDFEKAGELVIVDDMLHAFADLAGCIQTVEEAGLLPEKNAVGLDPMGVGLIVEALAEIGISADTGRAIGIPQGWKLNGAIKTTEVKLASGELWHGGQRLTAWAVGNAKVEPKGNAITITKQNAGTAKIDPLMATIIGVAVMSLNPESGQLSESDIRFL